MAKVTGPLFSQEARGQFAQTAVFTRRRGQNIARSYVIPSNPMTDNQIAQRIRLAAIGIVTRRVRATNWEYTGQTQTWIEYYQSRTRTGEVWNSALGREMLGPANANYLARLAEWEALDGGDQTAWTDEAEGTVGGLADYTRGSTTVASGFMLFLAQFTVAAAGYGEAFDPTTPFTLVNGG